MWNRISGRHETGQDIRPALVVVCDEKYRFSNRSKNSM
jgi:hypothetical protein